MNSERNLARRALADPEHPLDHLNRVELRVLQQLSMDASDGEIAQRLNVTEKTVRIHVSQILRKLALANRREATRLARKNGLRPA